MPIEDKKKQIMEDLTVLPDRFERFTYIVDFGRRQKEMDSSLRNDHFLVEGCQSLLWLVPEYKDDKCYFQAESDSSIVKGIAGLICHYYSDEKPEDILKADVDFLEEVGIDQHLSSNRRNGLGKVDERIKRFAKSCLEKSAT